MEPVCDRIDLQSKRSGSEAVPEEILVSSADAVAPPPADVVLIHCTTGGSRSATMVIAYLMRRYQWQRDAAIAYVRKKTGRVRPNQGFWEQLELWATMGYRVWEEDGRKEGEGTAKVPKSEYASYLKERAATLKAKGRTGFETNVPECL